MPSCPGILSQESMSRIFTKGIACQQTHATYSSTGTIREGFKKNFPEKLIGLPTCSFFCRKNPQYGIKFPTFTTPYPERRFLSFFSCFKSSFISRITTVRSEGTAFTSGSMRVRVLILSSFSAREVAWICR